MDNKPVRENFLVYGSPIIEDDCIDEVVETLKSGWIGTGPRANKLESMFKEYKGAKHAMALNSCTAGIHLALLAAGIGSGDEVITSPMTFCATANTVIHAGGTPIFADVERDTMNIDPKEIERKITKKTKAILPVHFAGRPCKMDEIMDIARRYGLKVIEDCAHAIETEYKGRKAGTFGDLGCFSFYVTKNIITGEGGMVITDNDEYASKIKILGLHGMSKDAWKRFSDEGYKHYQVMYPGFKYNMMDLQAAIGIKQMPLIEKYSKRRREIWNKYNEAFSELPVFTPVPEEKDTRHALHLYSLLIDIDKSKKSRDEVLNALHKENIGTGVHYLALHIQPYYMNTYGYKQGDYPNAEFISDRTLSLPLSPKLTDEDVNDVISAVKKVLT